MLVAVGKLTDEGREEVNWCFAISGEDNNPLLFRRVVSSLLGHI